MFDLNKYSSTQLQFLCARLEADSQISIAKMKHKLHVWQYGERMKIQVELSKRAGTYNYDRCLTPMEW